MEKISNEIYQKNPDRYTLVSGHCEGAPTCPYGNIQKWVGFDLEEKKYVRYTKSLYKKLITKVENKSITV